MSLFAYFEDVPPLSATQQWLLRALLMEAPECRDALRQWVENVDFDKLDYSSFRLMPALFLRHGSDPLCAPYRGRMKGIYRYFLFRTNLLAADARKAIEALATAGIELLLSKGLALALGYHHNLALRPMGDVDVLVHPEDVAKAETVLRQLGWQYRYSEAKKRRDIHSHDYINTGKSGFDLHWFALPESTAAGIDDAAWARSEYLDWQGMRVRSLAPEDLVLVAMVNGMREREAMRCEWISDVARIVESKPGFNWELLWAEAGKRQLREAVFAAMLLFNRIAPNLLPTPLLNEFLEGDNALAGNLLTRLVSENRTHALDRSQPAVIETLLSRQRPPSRFARLLPRRSEYWRLSRTRAAPKHIRYTTDGSGSIDSLYLHWQYLPLLARLFAVENPQRLRQLISSYPRQGEGRVPLPPGLLALPERDVLPRYHAQISVDRGSQKLVVPAGEVGEVMVNIKNDSPHYWFVRADSAALYGVSYHLCSASGELLQWDQPRTYFMQSRANTLAFVAPGQRLPCCMKVHAPAEPGKYRLQLDVLQETVLWFSGQGIRFPEVELEVIA